MKQTVFDLEKNRDLFLSILESHKGIIYKIANTYCQDKADQQDLIQEIIIQLWQSLDKYNSEFKVSTWLYRIALNTAISFYRKSKVEKQKTVELSPVLKTTVKADEPFRENPDLILLQNFIQELRALDKALILLYLEELSYKEIANIVGLTPTNVSTKIMRIKKTLKKKFQTIKSQDDARE